MQDSTIPYFLRSISIYMILTSTVSSVKSRVNFMSVGFHGNTCSCDIGYLFSLDTALVYCAEINPIYKVSSLFCSSLFSGLFICLSSRSGPRCLGRGLSNKENQSSTLLFLLPSVNKLLLFFSFQITIR